MPLPVPVNQLFCVNQWINSFSIGAAFCEPGLGYIFEIRAQNQFSHYCAVILASSNVTPNIADRSLLQEYIWIHFKTGKASIVPLSLFQDMAKLKRQIAESREDFAKMRLEYEKELAQGEEFARLIEEMPKQDEELDLELEQRGSELDARLERAEHQTLELEQHILENKAYLDSIKQQCLESKQQRREFDAVLASAKQQRLEAEEFLSRHQQEIRKLDEASKAALKILEDSKASRREIAPIRSLPLAEDPDYQRALQLLEESKEFRTKLASNRSSTGEGPKSIPVPVASPGVACFAQINAKQGSGDENPTGKLRSAMLKVIGLAFLAVCNLLTISGRASRLMQNICILSDSLIISYLINAAISKKVSRYFSSHSQTNE